MPVSHLQENTVSTIRSWRSQNALTLVASKLEVDKPAVPGRGILRAVLAAKITARQTVEGVCKKLVEAGPFSGYKYRDLLANVGLIVRLEDDGPKLVLLSAYSFKTAFPSLEHAVPLLQAYKGILVGTTGKPVAPIRLTGVKPCRQRSVSKAKVPTLSASPLSPVDISLLREFVMSRPLAGTTVRALLGRANGIEQESAGRMTAFTTAMVALCRYGIMMRYDESNVTAEFYAEVVDSKLLTRRIPELKSMTQSLDGLLLY